MLKLNSDYSDYTDETDVNYPEGKAINASTSESYDGTPLLDSFMNDLNAAHIALYKKAYGNTEGITGQADTQLDSQFANAVEKLVNDKVKAHADTRGPNAHGASYEANPGQVVTRNNDGRAQISYPFEDEDIANKEYVDEEATRAEEAEGVLTTAIENETTRATGVEGILANLNTTEKSNLVAALNELVANLATKSPLAGSASLTTYAGGTLGSAASKNMATGLSKTEVNPVPNNIVTQNIYGYLNTEVKKGSNDEFHNFKIAAGNVFVHNGTTLKVTFAKDCYCASSTAPSDTAKYPALSVDNGVTYHPIYVNQHGTPIPLPAHQIVSRTDADNISCNNYQWWWQAYTSFELMFVSSLGASGAWLIMGNPETVSYNSATESYKIKAYGLIKQCGIVKVPENQTFNLEVNFSIHFNQTPVVNSTVTSTIAAVNDGGTANSTTVRLQCGQLNRVSNTKFYISVTAGNASWGPGDVSWFAFGK